MSLIKKKEKKRRRTGLAVLFKIYANCILTITELFDVDSISNVKGQLPLSLANKVPLN